MFRITTLFLCAIFLASVAGRHRAEESVQEAREAIKNLDTEYQKEEDKVKMLRAEIAYLENPERLAKIARAKTDLRPPAAEEILSASEFRSAMAREGDTQIPVTGHDPAHRSDVAVAQLSDPE